MSETEYTIRVIIVGVLLVATISSPLFAVWQVRRLIKQGKIK